jgi:hypothetical protein
MKGARSREAPRVKAPEADRIQETRKRELFGKQVQA